MSEQTENIISKYNIANNIFSKIAEELKCYHNDRRILYNDSEWAIYPIENKVNEWSVCVRPCNNRGMWYDESKIFNIDDINGIKNYITSFSAPKLDEDILSIKKENIENTKTNQSKNRANEIKELRNDFDALKKDYDDIKNRLEKIENDESGVKST